MALFGRKADSSSDSASTTPAPNGSTATVDAAPDTASNGKAKKARAPKTPKAAAKPRGLKNGSAVGLNIGNSFIKAVEVTAKNGELSITGMGAVPTPPESYANGNVLSISALSSAIKTLWKQAGFKSKHAVFSVSGTGSLVVRVIEVPKMSDGELADNMRVDADRYIPFPPSEVIMDFKALRDLPSDPDAPNMEVLLAAAQREVIDLHVRVVQSSRLTPGAIDVEPIAAARAVALEKRGQTAYVDYDDVSALLNVGATGTEISVLRGDLVVFTRTVPIGGNNLTTAIAEGLGLPLHDAERFKIERGDALPPPGYDPNAASSFDFDEFGGGQNDLSYGAFDTTPGATSNAAASSDPFDLDFFNQNPSNNEPGTGHSQKEGEGSQDAGAFSFSFDNDFATPPSKSDTPTSTPAPDTSPAPTSQANSGGFSFDPIPGAGADEFLPTETSPVTPSAPAPAAQTPPSMPAPIPSAFDFSDFDLPATADPATTVAATSSATPAQAAAPPVTSGFGFTADPTSTHVAETAPASTVGADPLSLSKEPDTTTAAPTLNLGKEEGAVTLSGDVTPPPGDVLVAEANTAGNNDFDLDAIFGSTPNPEAVTPTTGSDESFDATGFGLGAAGGAAAGVVAGSATGNTSGFDLGAVGGTDDLGDFGVGLGSNSMTDADAITLYNAIHPVLEELAGEVRRSLEFHLGRYPDTTFTRLQLIGGGARLKNLDSYLTQMIGVPTAVATPSGFLKMNAPKLSPEYVATNSPLCAVALGLAIRDFIE